MYEQIEKPKENKSRAVANAVSQKRSSVKQGIGFVDNRPGAVAQQKVQMMANNHAAQQYQPIQKRENNTGLPDNLKSGIESLSGYSMDDVKVHYNSDKPAQLQAHAFAQGTDIHLATGQEKHLPHEAWHVVQQKQGRVKPTKQMKGGVNVNDDAGLEKEADIMGAKSTSTNVVEPNNKLDSEKQVVQNSIGVKSVLQGAWVMKDGEYVYEEDLASNDIKIRFLFETKGLTVESAEKWLKNGGVELEGNPKYILREFLYDSGIKRTYGFLMQHAFKKDLLAYNAKKHAQEQEDLLKSVVNMGEWILDNYPPGNFVYIGLGRSPGAILGYLQKVTPGNAFSVPISSFRPGPGDKWDVIYDSMTSNVVKTNFFGSKKIVKSPTPGLSKDQSDMLGTHFSEFIPINLLDKDVLLIDYTQGAQSLIAGQHYLQKYITKKRKKGKVFALALHEERHEYRVKGIHKSISEPRSMKWNPLDAYYNTEKRKDWGEHFEPKTLSGKKHEGLSEAFRRELFDDFSEHGSFKLLEQEKDTFERDRPKKQGGKNEGYDVLQDEISKVAGLKPSFGGEKTSSASSSKRGDHSQNTSIMGVNAHVFDLPGRIFGAMGAELEQTINEKERNGNLLKEAADTIRANFRREIDAIIMDSIKAIEQAPEQAEAVIRRGRVLIESIMRRYVS